MLATILNMLILMGCDIIGNYPNNPAKPTNPTNPTAPDTSFKVVIKGNTLVDGKINFGGKLTVAITDNKLTGDKKYQWTRDGNAISGATKEEYTISKTDADKTISVEVTIAGETVKATGIAIPKRTVTVEVGGSAIDDKGKVGTSGTLSAEATPNWEAEDKDGNELPITYQWKRGTTDITGATHADYVLTADDLGKTLTVKATYDSVSGTSEGVKVPTSSTQQPSQQTLAVTIIGTPGVGKRLTADVQKNFSGANEYQWLREGVAIQGEDWFEYTPEPKDAGKKISVKVTCGTATPATSTAVTIPALTFTAEADRWENILWTYAKIGDYTYEPNLNNGFTVQWLRNGSPISGATRPEYELTAEDAGKTIKAEIKGYNQTKYSQEFQINSLAPVQPVIDIEYEDHTTRSSNDIWTVMEEIQDAYDRNLANCKDAIRDTGKQNNWMIDICEAKLDRRAEIKNNKLHIWFSMRYYDEEFSEHERGLRLSYIGEELRTLVMGMSLGMEEENTDELEEGRSIHMGMGKLVKQQPKTLDDHA